MESVPHSTPSDSPRAVRPTVSYWLLLIALYFSLSVFLTWPLALHATGALAVGTEPAATVPLLNVWTILWNVRHLSQPTDSYWNAPIFQPEVGTFALSETQPLTFLVAPVLWCGGSPALAYNVFLFLSLLLNGICGCRLLLKMGGNQISAAIGGALLLSLPIAHWQLGILQLIPIFAILETWNATYDLARTPGFKTSFRATTWFVVSCLLCTHHGLFLAVLLVPASLWFLPAFIRGLLAGNGGKKLLLTFAGTVVPAVVLLMFLLPQQSIIRSHKFERSDELIRDLSLEAGDFTVSPWKDVISEDFADAVRRDYWKCGVGWLRLIVAVIGTIYGLCVSRYRTWTAFLLTIAVLSFVFALGTRWDLTLVPPYRYLVSWIPGFNQVRNVFRFAFFWQISILVLTTLGVEFFYVLIDHIAKGLVKKPAEGTAVPKRIWTGKIVPAMTLCIGLILCFEIIPTNQKVYFLEDQANANSKWVEWMKAQGKVLGSIAHLPFPQESWVTEYQDSAMQMYQSQIHGQGLVNGYSGFFPQSFQDMQVAEAKFPREDSLNILESRGVTYCVVLRHKFPLDYVARWSHPTRLLRIFEDEIAGVDIYQLFPEQTNIVTKLTPAAPRGIGASLLEISPLWFLIAFGGLSWLSFAVIGNQKKPVPANVPPQLKLPLMKPQ